MHRTLLEIDSAFEMLYGSDPRGMRSAWCALVCRLKASNSFNASKTLVPDTYTLPYPAKLSGPISVKNRTFVTDVPSPASLDPVSCMAKTEFVRLLAAELKSSLSAGFDPAVISARIDESGREAEAQDKNSISPPPPLCGFWIQSYAADYLAAKTNRIPSKGPDAKKLGTRQKILRRFGCCTSG